MRSDSFFELITDDEYYDNIEIIDYNYKIVIGRDKKTKKAYFFVRNEEETFIGNMLCEVNINFHSWINKSLKKNKYRIEECATDRDFYEILLYDDEKPPYIFPFYKKN